MKPAGFDSPQLAALGKNLSYIDTLRLAAGEFIFMAARALAPQRGGQPRCAFSFFVYNNICVDNVKADFRLRIADFGLRIDCEKAFRRR